MNYKDIIFKKYTNLTKMRNELLNTNNYDINIVDNQDEKILEIFSNKSKIFSATFEKIGTFDINTNIFIWANEHIICDKKFIKNINNIRKSKNELENIIINNKYTDLSYIEKLYYYLSHNIFIISFDNINELLNYCVSVSNSKGVVFEKNNKGFYVFYLII